MTMPQKRNIEIKHIHMIGYINDKIAEVLFSKCVVCIT